MNPSAFEIALSRCKSRRVISDPEEIMSLIAGKGRTDNVRLNADEGAVEFHKSAGSFDTTTKAISIDEARKLFEARGMPTDNEELLKRTVSYWLSDERVDEEGDIIRQNWDFSVFEKNSPIPMGHDWYGPPIGRMIDWNVRQRKEADYSGKALFGIAAFADTEHADSIYRLVSTGFLPSGSVGFRAQRVIRIDNDDDRNALGLGPWGLIFDKNLLIEYSVVTVPANPGAHLAGMMKGLQEQDLDVLLDLRKQQVGEETNDSEWIDTIHDVAKSVFGKTTVTVPSSDVTVILNDLTERVRALTEKTEATNSLVERTIASLEVLTMDVQNALDTRSIGEPSVDEASTDDGNSGDDGDGDDILATLRGHLDSVIGRINATNPAAD